MSLLKTMKKCGRPRNQSNYISFDESYPKMQVLSNLGNFVKGYGQSETLAFLPQALTKYG